MKALPWIVGLGGAAVATWAFLQSPRSSAHPPSGFWFKAVETFGGRPISPDLYPHTFEGLDRYLRASRVGSRFDARTISAPNHANVAASLGYMSFLPPQSYWPKTAALMAVANQMAGAELRNHWRPEDYNRHPRVDGKEGSAHIEAAAVDLDFETTEARERAEALVRGIQQAEPWLKVGIGVGRKSLHVDMLTDKPQRPNTWEY
jgi:hypothetical protein